MKTVKIGEKEYSRMENIFDIGDERFVVFKQWLLQSFEDIDKPAFLAMHNRITKHFNANDNYRIMVELENYKKSLDLLNLNYDAYSMCFALIHLQTDELQSNTSGDYQLKKLDEMRKEGLTRGLVEEVVENFISASPKHFQHYLGMLEVMRSLSKGEISNALSS